MDARQRAAHNAEFQARRLGEEVRLARTQNGQSQRHVARVAGISLSTEQRIERGDAGVEIRTMSAACVAVGLDLSLRAYPTRGIRLRDAGQLRIAEMLRLEAHPSWKVAVEHPISGGRSADIVFFGPDEIIHGEIYRLAADWQGQSRPALAKRDELQSHHARPVRLVMIFDDTDRNRRVLAEHASLIQHVLPAGSRKILRALRDGAPLGQDGLLWVRSRRPRPM